MQLFTLFQQSPVLAVVYILAIVAAVSFHEFAHAWAADRLGDDTPYLDGRLTLNPLAHLDPIGSLTFILFGFGWGKPVVYNPMRLSRRVDELLIALAGPASNLLFALVLNLVIFYLGKQAPTFSLFLGLTAQMNVILAAFNVIPLPPLDGSSIVAYFWPPYRSLLSGRIGLVILLAAIFIPIPQYGNLIGLLLTPSQGFFNALTHLFGHL